MIKKIGFIGLGVMGYNIAKHLVKHVEQLNILLEIQKKH